MIILVSSDKVDYLITYQSIKLIKTIYNMLVDVYTEDTNKWPLSIDLNIQSDLLIIIIDFCEYYHKINYILPLTIGSPSELPLTIGSSPKLPPSNIIQTDCKFINDAFKSGQIDVYSSDDRLAEYCVHKECHQYFRYKLLHHGFNTKIIALLDNYQLVKLMKYSIYYDIEYLTQICANELGQIINYKYRDLIIKDDFNNISKMINETLNISLQVEENNEIDKYRWIYNYN